MPQKYLRQEGSGHVYIHTEALAARSDMRAYEMPVEAPDATPDPAEPVDLDSMTREQLAAYGTAHGVSIPMGAKADMLAAAKAIEA